MKGILKQKSYTYLTMDEPVNLAWHQVTSTDANSYFADAVQNMTGVNVISPTWFSVTDNCRKYFKSCIWGVCDAGA